MRTSKCILKKTNKFPTRSELKKLSDYLLSKDMIKNLKVNDDSKKQYSKDVSNFINMMLTCSEDTNNIKGDLKSP